MQKQLKKEGKPMLSASNFEHNPEMERFEDF
jgi:hypothetical protein